jgi:hypothetical protein
LEIFSKVEVQKLNICACLSRLIMLDVKKNNFGYTLVEILTKILDQKCSLLAKEKFLQKQTLNIHMTISHLSEQLAS